MLSFLKNFFFLFFGIAGQQAELGRAKQGDAVDRDTDKVFGIKSSGNQGGVAAAMSSTQTPDKSLVGSIGWGFPRVLCSTHHAPSLDLNRKGASTRKTVPEDGRVFGRPSAKSESVAQAMGDWRPESAATKSVFFPMFSSSFIFF